MAHDEQPLTAALATTNAPTHGSDHLMQQQQLEQTLHCALLRTLLPELQQLIQRTAAATYKTQRSGLGNTSEHTSLTDQQQHQLAAHNNRHKNIHSSTTATTTVDAMDVYACLQDIRSNWSVVLEATGCDARVLELVGRALEHGSGGSCDELAELARLIGASDAAQSQIHALVSEINALRVSGGGAAKTVSAAPSGATVGSNISIVPLKQVVVVATQSHTDQQLCGSTAPESSEAPPGLPHIDRSRSNSSSFSTHRLPPHVDAAIQRRASAGHAVAQRFVAAHELVAQAQVLLHERLETRALESVRRAVVLWRHLAIDQRLLNTLLSMATDRVVASDSADACFVFAIGEDSAAADRQRRASTGSADSRSATSTADCNSDDNDDHEDDESDGKDHETVWRQCVAAHPSVAVFQYWLAHRLFARGKVRDAQLFVDKALALERNPQWLYLRAQCLCATPAVSLAHRVDAFQQYIAANPPDEELVPHAYYSLALLYLEQGEYVLAKRYQALAQLAERPPVRFPTFGLVANDFAPKRMLRIAFGAPLFVLSLAQQLECVRTTELECEGCAAWLPLTALLRHKMEACAQRRASCLVCGESMAPEQLLPHQEHRHSPS